MKFSAIAPVGTVAYFATKLSLDLSIRVRKFKLLCPKLPIGVRSWITQMEEDPQRRLEEEGESPRVFPR